LKLLLYLLLITIVLLLYFLFKNLKKNLLVTLVCSTFIIYFILYPKLCINSTLSGVKIFFVSVFPSLFPFVVMCNILLSYDGINIYSRLLGKYLCTPLKLPKSCSFVLIISAFCGYPLGAKYSTELYEKKIITKEQTERLLNIASNASPLFIVGAVGTSMLKSTELGYILLAASYISCFIMGLLLPVSGSSKKYTISKSVAQNPSLPDFGAVIRDSIDNAIKTSLSVGGYITLFSAVIDIIKNNLIFNIILSLIPENFIISKHFISGSLLGVVEITKGCFIISQSSSGSIMKMFIIGFLIGFSGLSIISQVYSFISRFPELRAALYIKRKFIQGLICGIFSAIIYAALYLNNRIQPTMTDHSSAQPGKFIILLLIIIIIILPFLIDFKKGYKAN
jgi:sporulation integral membrane protein YlbJ